MRKILFFLFSLLIGTGLLYWVIKVVGWEEIRLAFITFSGWQGLLILGLTFLMIISGILRWREILKPYGYNLSFNSLTKPYLAGFSISYLAPMAMFGGEIFRGYYIKENFSVPWKKATASVILDRILELTSYLLVILVGILFFFLKIGFPLQNLGLILIGTLVFLSAGIGFFYFKGFKKESMVKFFPKLFDQKLVDNEPLEAEKEIFNFLKLKKGFFWKAMGFTFLKIIFAFTRTWLLISFLGKTIGSFATLSILGFSYLVMLIPIPATIGTHEAIQAFAFGKLGLGAAGTGAAFTMIIRGAEISIALIGVFILLRLGIKLFEIILFKSKLFLK